MYDDASLNDFMNIDSKGLSSYLFSLSGNEFAIIGAVAGYLFSQPLDVDEINSLGNFFELIGQMMLSIASQAQVVLNDRKNHL